MPSKIQNEINKLRGEVSKDDKISNDNIKLLRKALTNAEIAIKALYSEDKNNNTKINQAIAIANRALSSANSSIKNSGNQTINGNLTVTSFRILSNLIVYGNSTIYGNTSLQAGITVDGRDLSVDGTKLDTIDTGADVTGSNPPQAHGAAVHTDRLREIYISKEQYTNGENLNRGVNLDPNVDEYLYYKFKLPNDYVSISSYKLIGERNGAVTGNIVMDIRTYGGASGEAWSLNDYNQTGLIQTVNNSNIITTNLNTDAFSSLTKNDYIYVRITRDANHASDTLNCDYLVTGLLIEYTADM